MDEKKRRRSDDDGGREREVIKEREQGGDAGCGQLSRASRSTLQLLVMKGAVQEERFGSLSWGSANHGAHWGMIKMTFPEELTIRGIHYTTLPYLSAKHSDPAL